MNSKVQTELALVADGLQGLGATLLANDLTDFQVERFGAAVRALGILAERLATELELLEADE